MTDSILQFFLEMNFCLLAYYGLFLFLEKRKASPSFLLNYLCITPILALLIPIIDFSLTDFVSTPLNPLIVSKSSFLPLAVSYSGNIILTIGDIFSFVYFLGFAYFGFKFLDSIFRIKHLLSKEYLPTKKIKKDKEFSSSLAFAYLFSNFLNLNNQDKVILNLSRNQTLFIHKIPTWIIHFFAVANWISPFSHLFSKKLKEISFCSKENNMPHKQSNYLSFCSFTSATVLLFALFSFNISNNFPFATQAGKIDSAFQKLTDTTLFDLHKMQKGTILNWGDHQLPIFNTNSKIEDAYQFLVPMMNRPFFKNIKDAELRFYKKGEKQRIIELEAYFNSPDFEEPLYARGREEFRKYVQAISTQREVSIFIKFKTDLGEEWTSALAITRYERLYNDNKKVAEFVNENSLFSYGLNMNEAPFFLVENGSEDVEEVDAIYTIKWGEIKIILEKYANPNEYIGNLKLDLKTIKENKSNQIEILKNGKSIGFTDFELYRLDPIDDNGDKYKPLKYEKEEEIYSYTIEKKLLEDVAEGTIFRFKAKTKDINIDYSFLQIIDPYSLYHSDKFVKKVSIEKPEYTFQIINLPNKKTTLKVDTTMTENETYMKMYKNRDNYDIIHVKDFKTNRRAINEDDFIWLEEEEKIQGQLDIFILPEYTKHIGNPLGLVWGDILANPGSIHYHRKDIIENNHAPLKIRLIDKDLDLEQFEIVVQHLEEQPIIHKIQRKNNELRLPDFSEIDTETSIFFQKIVIYEDDKFQFFPCNFAFYIGKETSEFELKIEEAEQYGERFDSITNKSNNFELIWKNSTIKDIISDLTLSHSNKIRLFGKKKNPKLNITYSSTKVNTRIGRSLMLQELRRRYRFTYSSNFETLLSYRLGIRYEDRLNNFIISEEKKKMASTRSCSNGGFEILEAATLDDLKNFIQDKFDEHVYLASSNDDAYYFSLDISSLDNLIQQLEADYGLQLVKGDYPVLFIDLLFVE